MEKENRGGRVDAYMRAHSKTASSKALVNTNGPTAGCIMGISNQTKRTDMVTTYGLQAKNTKDFGKKETSTAKDVLQIQKEFPASVSGVKVAT